ncbi:transcriptional regulator, ArsR family [Anaerofustis stercorihominis DSM 17244]|uniref:Transcriptional regulator, ArsR family n=3 Tax=Anaerofustis stercorihominis TaxID=214853 RepID=B1C9F7_9FIRM|nr:transcriptional regulator, ArsR family [Anaerofustis stercorihominis DSM 17244]
MNRYSYIKQGEMDMAANIETCELKHVHKDIVKEVHDKMPDEEKLYDLAELFKVFGDSTRIKILNALLVSEMCVCDIANILNMTQSAVSHQLKNLKNARLIKNRKDGKTVFYSLADEHVMTILNQGIDHIEE